MTPERFHDLASGRARGLTASLARGGLWLASCGYRIGSGIRNQLYDRHWLAITRANVPVISVGNLTVGGTGKTPCVEYLAKFFRERDVRVTILSRGYGVESGPNDEALVLEENLPDVPHLQGADRVGLAATAIEELETELLILDDGFQHRRLARDLDIVLVDATNPWGHGYLFPRGLLREPKRALKRASAVVITHSNRGTGLQELRSQIVRWAPAGCPIVESNHRPVEWMRTGHASVAPTSFQAQKAGVFCGLGNPDSFRRTVTELAIEIIDWRTFPDHHGYTRGDVSSLQRWAETLPDDALMLTTQKDAVKLRLAELADRPLWALRIGLEISAGRDRDEFQMQLEKTTNR